MKTHSSPPRVSFALWCALAFACTLSTRAQDISVNIGTLNPGESVTMTYKVTISALLSPSVTQIPMPGNSIHDRTLNS